MSLQMKYFSSNDTVAILEPSAPFFRVYNAESMQLRRHYDIKVSTRSPTACLYDGLSIAYKGAGHISP